MGSSVFANCRSWRLGSCHPGGWETEQLKSEVQRAGSRVLEKDSPGPQGWRGAGRDLHLKGAEEGLNNCELSKANALRTGLAPGEASVRLSHGRPGRRSEKALCA